MSPTRSHPGGEGILCHMCPWPKAHPIYSSPCQTLTHSTALAEGSVMVVSLGIIKKTNLGEMSACMHIPPSAPILPCLRRPGLVSTSSPHQEPPHSTTPPLGQATEWVTVPQTPRTQGALPWGTSGAGRDSRMLPHTLFTSNTVPRDLVTRLLAQQASLLWLSPWEGLQVLSPSCA